ncbi:hypothetical protein [Shewanella waksmanii]|uniref:hypothetical protein n=1 Tax=Shewanella waksmanii TaxID=213783 RepID=UPI00048B8649|nr:hypothetical protein [Shewanella waksmanii]
MSRLAQAEKIQPHWWRKSIFSVLLGLSLAYGVIAIFAWFGPGGIDAAVKVQFNMWATALLWLLVLSLSFLFKTGNKTLIYLLLANLVTYLSYATLWWLV